MNAYVYRAALYCPHCAAAIKERLDAQGRTPAVPADEGLYDSDDYPKGPYADGGGEADSPQHCADCQVSLGNPLTDTGIDYVLDQLFREVCAGKVTALLPIWGGHYAKMFACEVVLDWAETLRSYGLEPVEAARLQAFVDVLRYWKDNP